MSTTPRTSRGDAWTCPGHAPGSVHAPNTCRGYVERVFSPSPDTSASTAKGDHRAASPGFPRWVLSFLSCP